MMLFTNNKKKDILEYNKSKNILTAMIPGALLHTASTGYILICSVHQCVSFEAEKPWIVLLEVMYTK